MITIQGPSLPEILGNLFTEKEVKAASYRAINRSLIAGRKAAGEEVARDYNVTGGKVSKIGKITKANSGNISGKINWKGPAIELKTWGTNPGMRKKKKNPRVWGKVSKSTMAMYSGAFLGRASGKTRAFIRTSKKRFPIVPVYGPSLPQLVGAERVRKRFVDRSNEMLKSRLEHEFNYILSQRG